MADVLIDFFPIIISIIAVIIAPVLIYFSRQNTTTILSTFKLETYTENVTKLEQSLAKLDGDIEKISRKQDNLDWRLQLIESRFKNGGKMSSV